VLVGILSDSHGDAASPRRAVELLVGRGARMLFHCGDICGEAVLDELAGHDCTFVWGNCDRPTQPLRDYVEAIGLTCPTPLVRVVAAGKRIALFHGHEAGFRRARQDARLDYVFYGHTHQRADHRDGVPRLINPGALHRASVKTVALLDLASADVVFLRIDTGEAVEG